MTPEEQLCADLAPLQDRASEPDEFPMRGCTALVCIMGAVLIACAYGAPSAWDWAVIQIEGTR